MKTKIRTLIFQSLLALVTLGYAKPQIADPISISERACVCVPNDECLVGDPGIQIVQVRNQYCNPGQVCCLFQNDLSLGGLSEDDLLRILDGTNVSSSFSDVSPSDTCACIHEDQCDDPDQSLFTLVRTGNRCSLPFHVCCDNPIRGGSTDFIPTPEPPPTCQCVNIDKCHDIINGVTPRIKPCIIPTQICCNNVKDADLTGPDPTHPNPREPDNCICVHEDDCYDPELDLFLNVNLRIKLCTKPFHVCCKYLGLPTITEPPPSPYDSPNCGVRSPTPIAINLRVAGSTATAQEGEYPWMVAIMRKNKTGHYVYACGGSLIHPSVVLTVAHCIEKDDDHLIQVRIGELDLSGPSEILGHAEIYVTGRILHPYFSRRSLRFDLGLLFLEEAIMPNQHINTICLPGSKTLMEYHKECFSSGFGKDAFGDEGTYQSNLKKVNLPLVSNHDCQAALRTTRLTHKFKLHRTFICAGGEGKDTCSGDGGSPLVCPLSNTPKKHVQVGAVAWGVGCGMIGIPGVYAYIEPVMQWIVQTVNSNYGEKASEWFTL